MHFAVGMAVWVKAILWIAVVLLPGGLLLAPVVLAFHQRDRRARARAVPVAPPALSPDHEE